MMMLGRELRLPADLGVECPAVEDKVQTDFERLRHNLQEAHAVPGSASGGVRDDKSGITTARYMVKG